MASNPEFPCQILDVGRTNQANQANSRRSTMSGNVQNGQGKPRWNASTKISSSTENAHQKTETADQRMERFRKREEALVNKSVSVRNKLDVPNPGHSLGEPQAREAPASSTRRSGGRSEIPQDGAAPASTGSEVFTKKKMAEPKEFSLEKLRVCVQEEAHTDKSSRDYFHNIWRKMREMGCPVEACNEVEYWIMMIGIEELELERSANPNRRSFSDLPAELLSRILGNLDPISRLITRNVSKTLRSIVDSEKPNVKSIELTEYELPGTRIYLSHSPFPVTFYQMENGCRVNWRRKDTIVKGLHYIKFAIQLLKPILSNSKLKLVQFHASFQENRPMYQKLFDIMSEVVKSTNNQFYVEHLCICGCTEEQLNSWLPLFKPGVLHNLEVVVDARRKILNCLKSEQFKGAKSTNFIAYAGLKPSLINHFLHFEAFRVCLTSFRVNEILRLMEDLSTSNTFKRCDIEVLFDLNLNAIEEAFEVLPADPIRQEGQLYVEVSYIQFSLCFWFETRRFTIIRKLEEL